ncbi:protein-disulfide reductase DsbD [Polaromonas sp. A23]|uniref:protein-disulfide reductase DsbD family protein n=1 Tax=Polaromonas sp. A23 TaxID=1944133 RepID=UPI000986C4A9|nr:thioredoxin family protein [Polaromonas sp. A23]
MRKSSWSRSRPRVLRAASAPLAFARLACAALLIVGSAFALPVKAQVVKSVVTTERARAELLAHAPDGVEPGKALWVGLQLAHQPEWHTYWKNSGDSGLPTQLQWTLPPGVEAGEIAWPIPKKYPIGNLANYGYSGTVLLPVPLTVTPQFKPSLLGGDLEIKLKAQWLICRQECVPEEGEFALKIPARSATALYADVFNASFQAQPRPLAGAGTVRIDGGMLRVSVPGLPAEAHGKVLGFFPETKEVIETAAPVTQSWDGKVWNAVVPLSLQRSQSPAVMPLVLTLGDKGWRTEAQVVGQWPQVVAATGVSPALEEALRRNSLSQPAPAVSLTLAAALLGALLGGLILNLMPCVFPVLAIKVMGFARHADDRRAHRVSGLAFSAGVVLSFVLLGALLIGLRAAGQQLGWGFQLQSPLVVATLAALFTVIGLNLAGVFEFGAFLPSKLATLESRHPVANSFLSGVLAVAIASPCTAPFMGASLGLAVTLPTPQALLVFAALGFGMALPYLAAGWIPAVARLLPRPGPWMVTLRQFMAFPMFATVTWLLWVLGQQSGIDGAASLLVLLVAMSMVIWSLTLIGRSRGIVGGISLVVLALLMWHAGQNITAVDARPTTAASDGAWQPWEPGRVEQLLATGRPVFVDFTAAWCVTCQYNKKTTLANPAVLADLSAKNVALVRADWTRRDPAVTEALGQLGRNGVPVYVLYQSGRQPVVLSEVLSVDEVRAAVASL